jgi:TM2 domain-containing membrane protein YozV
LKIILTIKFNIMKPTKTYYDRNQTMWEYWLITSIIIFLCYFFIGTLPNSIKEFPNWLIFFLLSVINLTICIFKGIQTKY